MAEHWRVGRHVPHHVYRGDGNTVADEVAVTHRPEAAAQIVADHADVVQLREVLARIVWQFQQEAQRGFDAANWHGVAELMADYARDALAGQPQ